MTHDSSETQPDFESPSNPLKRLLNEFMLRRGSAHYWKTRYAVGGTSGVGSYGKFATFKAHTINRLLTAHQINSIVDLGCGDGNQAKMIDGDSYLGVDVSQAAIQKCRRRFAGTARRSFLLLDDFKRVVRETSFKADATISLDVIYHLIEEVDYRQHLELLFNVATKMVLIYSSDVDRVSPHPHLKHRKFTADVSTAYGKWELAQVIRNAYPFRGDHRHGSFADFFVYLPSASNELT